MRPTNRWSRRGYRRDEAASSRKVALRVVAGAEIVPRGSTQPLGGRPLLLNSVLSDPYVDMALAKLHNRYVD